MKQYQIIDILNKHDPMGLLKTGAPKDEYDYEALLIFEHIERLNNQINKIFSFDWYSNITFAAFVVAFGRKNIPDFRDEIWDNIGKDLKELHEKK